MSLAEHVLQFDLGSGPLRVVSFPGFADWQEVTPPDELLAEYATCHQQGARIWVYPAGHGALALEVARRFPNSQVTAFDTQWIACEAARRTLQGVSNVRLIVGMPGPEHGQVDVVLLKIPKGRDLVRRLYAGVLQSLAAAGRVYVAGANKQGIKTAVSDAEAVWGSAIVLAYRRGCRVVQFQPDVLHADWPEAYLEPGVLADTRCEYDVEVGAESYKLRTRPGVFSWQELDDGTALLLDQLVTHKTDRILDVGCGCGIIGLHAARLAPQGEVVMIDVDALACECANENIQANGITNAHVIHGEGVSAVEDQRFDLVVSNPPFHSSFVRNADIARGFIEGAFRVLNNRGRLIIVANRFLKYDEMIVEQFGAVRILFEDSRYYVLTAEKHYRRSEPVRKEPLWRW